MYMYKQMWNRKGNISIQDNSKKIITNQLNIRKMQAKIYVKDYHSSMYYFYNEFI